MKTTNVLILFIGALLIGAILLVPSSDVQMIDGDGNVVATVDNGRINTKMAFTGFIGFVMVMFLVAFNGKTTK